MEEIHQLAKECGGQCLSSSLEPFSLMTFRCKEGHQWQAAPFMIKTKEYKGKPKQYSS
jgi:hypothetical protein